MSLAFIPLWSGRPPQIASSTRIPTRRTAARVGPRGIALPRTAARIASHRAPEPAAQCALHAPRRPPYPALSSIPVPAQVPAPVPTQSQSQSRPQSQSRRRPPSPGALPAGTTVSARTHPLSNRDVTPLSPSPVACVPATGWRGCSDGRAPRRVCPRALTTMSAPVSAWAPKPNQLNA